MQNIKRIIQKLLWIGLGIVLGLSILGFFSDSNWFFDIATHFRVQYLGVALLATILALMLRSWGVAVAGLVIMVMNAALIFPLYQKPTISGTRSDDHLVIYQLNTYAENKEYDKILQSIRKVNPDIITVQEVTEEWLNNMKPELSDYEFQKTQIYPFRDKFMFGPAVFSKRPLTNIELLNFGTTEAPSIKATVILGEKYVNLIVVHPMSPDSPSMYRTRKEQFKGMTAYFRDNNDLGDVILVGDLNTTSWSNDFRQLLQNTNLRDTRNGFGIQSTWSPGIPLMNVPIDHILVTPGIDVLNRYIGPDVGSDHHPVIIELTAIKEQ